MQAQQRQGKMTEFEKSSGNIFADLGIPQPEEALMRADLALAIGRRISEQGWTQKRAAQVLNISYPDVANMARGRLEEFSTERLIHLLGCPEQSV
jgi:predicted XRE-type DNA-binding protein